MNGAALEYLKRGWSVLPLFEAIDGRCACGNPSCQSVGKHPRCQHGVRDATCDPQIIQAWWKQWPSANIGIATGSRSGIVVLDIDDTSVLDTHQFETLRSRTGRGLHLYFQLEGANMCSKRLRPGLEVKADGAYVLAPPSVHPNGAHYEWANNLPLKSWALVADTFARGGQRAAYAASTSHGGAGARIVTLPTLMPELKARFDEIRHSDASGQLTRCWRGEVGDGSSDSRYLLALKLSKAGMAESDIAAIICSRHWFNRRSRQVRSGDYVARHARRLLDDLAGREHGLILYADRPHPRVAGSSREAGQDVAKPSLAPKETGQ